MFAVSGELVGRGEYIALGQLLDAATERIIRDVAAAVPAEALLRIGFYAQSNAHLTRAVSMLPPERLRAIVHRALSGPPDLRAAGLALIGRLDNDRLRGQVAEHAAETLTGLLRTALAEGAVPELLTAVAAMGRPARQRGFTLPAFAEHDVLVHLVKAAATYQLEDRLESIAEHLPRRAAPPPHPCPARASGKNRPASHAHPASTRDTRTIAEWERFGYQHGGDCAACSGATGGLTV